VVVRGDWNLQDWKKTDHQKTGGVEFAGLENDGLENDGPENDGVEQEQTYILHTGVYDMTCNCFKHKSKDIYYTAFRVILTKIW